MNYATDKVLKTFESKLKKLDTELNKLDDFKVNVKSDLHQEIIAVLRDERQVFHQVVADSLTKYVSELQDTLKQSTQALVQSQKHLDAVVQELQYLQYERDNNHSSSNSNE
jgi:septal ring factor EnvC (AmiA/AmiB activator)